MQRTSLAIPASRFSIRAVYTFPGFRPVGPRPAPAVRLQEIVSAMTDATRHLLICSCEDTMPLDAGAVRRGCRGEPTTATQLCRAELDRFRAIAAKDTPLTVGCTQEAALFSEVAAEAGRASAIDFANVREAAGWSSEAAQAGPKMAALLAAAAEPVPPVPSIELQSGGGILIFGGGGGGGGRGQPAKA